MPEFPPLTVPTAAANCLTGLVRIRSEECQRQPPKQLPGRQGDGARTWNGTGLVSDLAVMMVRRLFVRRAVSGSTADVHPR